MSGLFLSFKQLTPR